MSTIDSDASKRITLLNLATNYPYTPSIASSASSSVTSIFSAEAHSSQSSAPSSSKSAANVAWDSENSESEHEDHISPTEQTSAYQATTVIRSKAVEAASHDRPSHEAVAPELRQHPRRTQPAANATATNGCLTARAPPSLVRQCDRKDNFVESLVGKLILQKSVHVCVSLSNQREDTTTQMIEVIWPLSVIPCGRDTVLGGKNLIGLRTFIQEVLKRSKTSYSTLQVALYYLVLIKPYIPNIDFTMEQSEESHAARAMQCGRRMFLAALILASKYLQDRNYSARAWSKISGLKISEINVNEMAFVTAIDWKLHVPEALFQRWTDVVFRFSPSAQSPAAQRVCFEPRPAWKSIIPRLTPQLDQILDGGHLSSNIKSDLQLLSSSRSSSQDTLKSMSPPKFIGRRASPPLSSNEQTPTMPYTKPQILEPTPRGIITTLPRFPPISPPSAPLPTPLLTPQSSAFSTPAVSAHGFCIGRSSMGIAMAQATRNSLLRSTLDHWPQPTNPTGITTCKPISLPTPTTTTTRHPSSLHARPTSPLSSPDSMTTSSTRSSRSSSISSAFYLSPPTNATTPLAIQATRRCATKHLRSPLRHESIPTSLRTSPDAHLPWPHPASISPEIYAPSTARESYLRADKSTPVPPQHPLAKPRFQNCDSTIGLQDLALTRPPTTVPIAAQPTPAPPSATRKRERPVSRGGDSELQERVRALLAEHQGVFPAATTCSSTIGRGRGRDCEDESVLADDRVADSFLLRAEGFTVPVDSRIVMEVEPRGEGEREREAKRSRMGGAEGRWRGGLGVGMWEGVL